MVASGKKLKIKRESLVDKVIMPDSYDLSSRLTEKLQQSVMECKVESRQPKNCVRSHMYELL